MEQVFFQGDPDEDNRKESIRYCKRLQLPIDGKLEFVEGSSNVLVTENNHMFNERGIITGIFKYWNSASARKLIHSLRVFRIRYDDKQIMLQDADHRFFAFSVADLKEFYVTNIRGLNREWVLSAYPRNMIQPQCVDAVIIKDGVLAHFQFFISRELLGHFISALPDSECKHKAILNLIL